VPICSIIFGNWPKKFRLVEMVRFIGTVNLLNLAGLCMNQKNAESTTPPSSQSRAPGGVLRMVDSGQSVSYTAEALGISEALIYGWKNKNKMGKEKSVQQSGLSVENQQLRERVRQLEAEREILKKALSIFSRAS